MGSRGSACYTPVPQQTDSGPYATMLQKNPLFPPAPVRSRPPAASEAPPARRPLAAAEDFDATGILVGMDPFASRYWWLPELYEPDGACRSAGSACCPPNAVTAVGHATNRAVGAPPAAA
jgi:hypothetical protein